MISLPVLFTYRGGFAIINQEYRASLADRDSEDYKQLAADVKDAVRNKATFT